MMTKVKQFPLVIRSVDQDTGLVNSELLSLPVCIGSAAGKNIFQLLDEELSARNLQWDNCLALGTDNAPVMTGCKKGVISFIEKKQPNVFFKFLAGCCLH